jgi:hypothetical protein
MSRATPRIKSVLAIRPGEILLKEFLEPDRQSWLRYREYIGQDPVKAGLVDSAEQYPYSYTYLAGKKHRG